MLAKANELAERFKVEVVDGSALAGAKPKHLERFLSDRFGPGQHFVFLLDAGGLRLHATGELHLSIHADFHGPTVTYRRKKGGGRGQMIAKAVGLKSAVVPTVLDCTAGLGGDAFVLASLGCPVAMVERVPEVRALLADALEQARKQSDPELDGILDRMTLLEADAVQYLQSVPEAERPDVIYLDPMFPERSKSALVKKEMRLFHRLVGTDPDADALLLAALPVARKRVVVKRPRIAPALAGPPPSHTLEGKSNRYDIYVGRVGRVGFASNVEHRTSNVER